MVSVKCRKSNQVFGTIDESPRLYLNSKNSFILQIYDHKIFASFSPHESFCTNIQPISSFSKTDPGTMLQSATVLASTKELAFIRINTL